MTSTFDPALIALACAAVGLPLAFAPVQAEPADVSTYGCASGAPFNVREMGPTVIVTREGREVAMRARPSNLGRRYVSDNGTLIIDAPFATLVFDDDLRFQSCTEKHDVADNREGAPR